MCMYYLVICLVETCLWNLRKFIAMANINQVWLVSFWILNRHKSNPENLNEEKDLNAR